MPSGRQVAEIYRLDHAAIRPIWRAANGDHFRGSGHFGFFASVQPKSTSVGGIDPGQPRTRSARVISVRGALHNRIDQKHHWPVVPRCNISAVASWAKGRVRRRCRAHKQGWEPCVVIEGSWFSRNSGRTIEHQIAKPSSSKPRAERWRFMKIIRVHPCRRIPFVVADVHRQGDAELAQIIFADGGPSGGFCFRKPSRKQPRQNGDNRDHNQEFHQRECAVRPEGTIRHTHISALCDWVADYAVLSLRQKSASVMHRSASEYSDPRLSPKKGVGDSLGLHAEQAAVVFELWIFSVENHSERVHRIVRRELISGA